VHATPARTAPAGAVEELVAFEEAARARTDWSSPRPWTKALGPDPFALVQVAEAPPRWIGTLRGANAVVLLDANGRELDRAAAPASTTGLAVLPDGEIASVGEASSEIALHRLRDDELALARSIRLDGVLGLRDVAASQSGKRLFVLDAVAGRVLAIEPDREPPSARPVAPCAGPVEILAVGPWVIASCLLDHAILVLDESGAEHARIVHDGPIWSIDALEERDGDLLVAAGGVEDRPLDRRDGSFGYIDSFAWIYRVGRDDGIGREAKRIGELNLSALGVVTPKWIRIGRDSAGALSLATGGYGSAGLVYSTWASGDPSAPPTVRRAVLPPGTTAHAGSLAADPLLDAWIVLGEDRWRAVPAAHIGDLSAERSVESRLGEALFFTTLMAPWNESEGRESRFTCETCHFEGYVDGRTHFSGRDDVFATTKPLVGLHGNRPYFSRALDPTMGRMVQNEFRVANRGSGHDPWFAVEAAEHPWLRAVEGAPTTLAPAYLRRSLMTFLVDLNHTQNPATRGRRHYSALERRGAEVFRDRCEGCHAARLVSDDASSRVPFEEWESGLFASEPIVWGREGYEKTGVLPYVHADGARVPSLRRLYKKRPYFTNGSARSLDDVLVRARFGDGSFVHDGELPSGEPLEASDREALRAFLGLL